MTVESSRPLFSLEDFHATREALRGKIDITPLQRSDSLSELTGAEIYLKLESFQRTNSFKVRGAYGALLARLEEARQHGVVTGSSGNFAQGLAYAGHELDVPVTVVMLERSAPNKVEAARQWGAEIVFCENKFAERTKTVDRIQRETGKLLIHSYDEEGTIHGNGTVGLELLEQLPGMDIILAPASGGGILSGIAAVVKQARPDTAVYGVQPEANPSLQVSLQAGKPTTVNTQPSIADGLIATCPGKLPFDIIQSHVEDVLLVSEVEIAQAVVHLLEQDKLVIEPSGAVGVAALLRHMKEKVPGKNVVVVLTGGNLAQERLDEIITLAKNGAVEQS